MSSAAERSDTAGVRFKRPKSISGHQKELIRVRVHTYITRAHMVSSKRIKVFRLIKPCLIKSAYERDDFFFLLELNFFFQ